jgi:hypothetical protein
MIAVVAIIFLLHGLPEQPARSTTARITQIGSRPSRFYPHTAIIVAQTGNGVIGEATVQGTTQLCNVGDEVKATQIGATLELDVRHCAGERPIDDVPSSTHVSARSYVPSKP